MVGRGVELNVNSNETKTGISLDKLDKKNLITNQMTFSKSDDKFVIFSFLINYIYYLQSRLK